MYKSQYESQKEPAVTAVNVWTKTVTSAMYSQMSFTRFGYR